MDTITLAPGIYSIVPFDEPNRRGMITAPIDPDAAFNHEERCEGVSIEPPTGIGIHPLDRADAYAVRLDDAGVDMDAIAITTPFGPLTLARHYLIVRAEALSGNMSPAEQYAVNWTGFEATAPTTVSVKGSKLLIGDLAIDIAALSDVATTTHHVDGREMNWGEIVDRGLAAKAGTRHHVARAGDPVHAVLAKGTWRHDDGVIVILTFTPGMLAEMQALDGETAGVFARDMAGQAAAGRSHLAIRPAIGWNASSEAMAGGSETKGIRL